MNPFYRHRQVSVPALVSGVVLGAPFAAALLYLLVLVREPGLPKLLYAGPLIGVLLLVIAIHGAVSSLTIEVGADELRWHFGPGVWRKSVPFASIARVDRVRLPWWYGIGIKYIPGGWVYLVAPGHGIEIVTADGRIARLGTDDPDGLADALACARQSPSLRTARRAQ